MQIRLEVYLPFRGKRSWKGEEEVPAGISSGGLLRHLELQHHLELTILVNGRYLGEDAPIAPGDEVAILPQTEGGD